MRTAERVKRFPKAIIRIVINMVWVMRPSVTNPNFISAGMLRKRRIVMSPLGAKYRSGLRFLRSTSRKNSALRIKIERAIAIAIIMLFMFKRSLTGV